MTPIVAAMQEASGAAGASLTHVHQESPGPMAVFLGEVIRRGEADALILFTHQPLHFQDVEPLAVSGAPYVVFNRYVPDQPLNCVVIDDHAAAERAGLHVPEDLSVIGFANLPGSDLVDPPLTTMGYDRPEIGRRTIAALLHMAEGGTPVGKVVVPAVFVERASCGPVS